MNKPQIIGWREWVEFPEWSVRICAKADTGAKSSAIDCVEIIELPDNRVRFTLRLDRAERKRVTLEAPIVDHKTVRSSTGRGHTRIFVETTLKLGEVEKRIRVNLVNRKRMIHRVLLGREALKGDFLVDSNADHWKKAKKGKRRSPS